MKKTLKLWSLLIAISMVFSLLTVFGGMVSFGAGTIEIDTAEKLRKIGRDAAYPMDGDYVLTADIDLSAEEWLPIGVAAVSDTNEVVFTGTFDGQGHVISGMHTGTASEAVATTANAWGLFSYLKDATVKNVAFKDVYFNVGINASNTNMALGAACGLIAGASTIENVAVLSGTIQDVISTHQTRVAGIAGAYTGTSAIRISNCFNAATIVAKHSRDYKSSYAIAAGILGNPKKDEAHTVSNCFNMGKISSFGAYTGTSPSNQSFTGNIITFAGKDSTAINATLSNNMALEGLLTNTGSSTSYSKDAAATTLVSGEAAKSAASFKALTDVENGSVWVCTDGKYPMLKTFEKYAIAVPGMDAGVIHISTADQLRLIGRDDKYPMHGDYVLDADIDLSDKEWVPIGSENTVFFTGTFDGNGHVISNLHIGTKTEVKEISDANIYAYGMFSYLGADAEISNLLLKDVCINIKCTGRTNLAVGAVAGYSNATGWSLKNIAVLSGYIAGANQRQNRVGGILGATTNKTTAATIENCFNGATIVSGYTNTSGNCYAGAAGIVGFADAKNLAVKNCMNIGSIITTQSGSGKNCGSIGTILAYPSTSATIKTALNTGSTLSNSFSVENLLSYDTTSTYTDYFDVDASTVTLVSVENAKKASSFKALTDVENGSIWVCEEGKYPMLKIFANYAVTVSDTGVTPPPVVPDPEPDPEPVEPIEIRTEAELRKIGVDAAYPLDGSYILMADIDMTNSPEWVAIGGVGFFSGTFNGNGHAIIGLHIGTKTSPKVTADADLYSYGLFSNLGEKAHVSNLLFKDICINVSATGRTNVAIGAVAGYSNKAGVVIENVAVVSGFLKGSCQRQTRVAGILGVTRHADGSLIRNCYNGAEIQGTYTSTATSCYVSVAGIVGFYESAGENPGIVNCFNAGKVVALKTSGTTNYSSIGAIAALAKTSSSAFGDQAAISNSYTIKNLLDYDELHPDRISQFASDANSAKVKALAPVVAGIAQAYAGLVNGSDGAWTAKDGFYPMLTIFKDHAVAVDVEGDIESYLKEILKEQYISNALTQDAINAVVKDALGDSFTVNTCTLELVKATAAKNGTYKISVAFTDGVKNYSVVLDGTFALPKIEYTFRTEQKGLAEGTVKVTDPAYRTELSYALYWGTAEGLLEGYASIASKSGLKVSGTVLTYEFPDRVVIPEKATHLWVVVDGTPVVSYAIPASRALVLKNLIYNYGMLSDIHFYDSGAPVAFTPAMNLFASAQVKFMASTGDFSNSGTSGNWRSFTSAYTAGGWTFPVWTATGNHDILKWNIADTVTPTQAMSYLKGALETYANADYTQDKNGNKYKVTVSEKYPDYDYTVEFGDDLFIYMGIGAFRNDSPKNVDQHLALDQLKWLDGVLSDYYEKSDVYGRVYLVFHYYTMESGFGMYQNGSTSGTEWSRNMNGFMTSGYNSSEELYKILSKYPNVIHFSGHTHRVFEKNNNLSVTRKYIRVNDNGNYKKASDPLGYVAVHVPGLRANEEGYLVSVYENGVLLTGYNFGTGEVVPSASFFLSNDEVGTQLRTNEASGNVEYAQLYGEWQKLIAQSDLKDAQGKAFELRVNDTHVQWKYTDETAWRDLIAQADLTDKEGNAAELKTENGYIKVRYGTGNWADLAELKAAPENPGTSDVSSSFFAVAAALAVVAGGAVIFLKKKVA